MKKITRGAGRKIKHPIHHEKALKHFRVFSCAADGHGTIFPVIYRSLPEIFFMNKAASHRSLLQLLVRVYNQSIQSYYYFPEVIICGNHRLEKEEFELLMTEGLLEAYYTDSFGRLYHLSKKAQEILSQSLHRRKSKSLHAMQPSKQVRLPFY